MGLAAIMIFLSLVAVFCFYKAVKSGKELASPKTTKVIIVNNQSRDKDGDLSRPARRVMDSFNNLPEVNRPAYHVRDALVALDKKYSVNAVDNHIDHQGKCHCNRPTGMRNNPNCEKYPEYAMLLSEFRSLHAALRQQKEAEEKRERAIMLAGIENDLRSVDDIVKSLRTEREAIDETTKELKV